MLLLDITSEGRKYLQETSEEYTEEQYDLGNRDVATSKIILLALANEGPIEADRIGNTPILRKTLRGLHEAGYIEQIEE